MDPKGIHLTIFKRPRLFELVNRVKLWPSRKGILHGIRETEDLGSLVRIATYCGEIITAKASRRCRAARWLRNRWTTAVCPRCGIPAWKIERFAKSVFRREETTER